MLLLVCLLILFCFLSWWSCNREERGYGGLGGEPNWGALCETPKDSIDKPKRKTKLALNLDMLVIK